MTALSANTMQNLEKWSYYEYTLTSGHVAYQNGIACVDTSAGTGYVVEGDQSTTYTILGVFDEYVDASSAAKTVRVNFLKERTIKWFVSALTASAVGKMAFIIDDQTVDATATAQSPCGLIMAYDATKGIAVDLDAKGVIVAAAPTISDFTNATHAHSSAATGGTLTNPIISGFTSANHTHASQAQGGGVRMAMGTVTFTGNTCSLTATNWTHYVVGDTGATASVVVVAATGTQGDHIRFTADGAANTVTITYYNGSTAMTSALTASKAHLVDAVFDGTGWAFNPHENAGVIA